LFEDAIKRLRQYSLVLTEKKEVTNQIVKELILRRLDPGHEDPSPNTHFRELANLPTRKKTSAKQSRRTAPG